MAVALTCYGVAPSSYTDWFGTGNELRRAERKQAKTSIIKTVMYVFQFSTLCLRFRHRLIKTSKGIRVLNLVYFL